MISYSDHNCIELISIVPILVLAILDSAATWWISNNGVSKTLINIEALSSSLNTNVDEDEVTFRLFSVCLCDINMGICKG